MSVSAQVSRSIKEKISRHTADLFAGFSPMFAKEILEIRRTWKNLLLPLLIGFSAVASPFLARFMPQILRSIGGPAFSQIQLDTATYLDSYAQWTKSLTQLILIVAMLCTASTVTREINDGTAQTTLSYPISRSAFLLAKLAADTVYLIFLSVLGALTVTLLTHLVFAYDNPAKLMGATAVWLIGAFFFLCIALVASVSLSSSTAAIGVGLAVYLLMSLGTLIPALAHWTPIGTLSFPNEIISAGKAPDTLGSSAGTFSTETAHTFSMGEVVPCLVVTVVLSFILLAAATHIFRRRTL